MAVVFVTVCVYRFKKSNIHLQPLKQVQMSVGYLIESTETTNKIYQHEIVWSYLMFDKIFVNLLEFTILPSHYV